MTIAHESELDELRSLFALHERTVVVTGGASGLGRHIALGAAAFGARVAILDRDLRAATEVVDAIKGVGIPAAAYECDVADEASVGQAMAAVTGDTGSIHGLVNSAGIGVRRPAETMTVDEWRRVIDVNLMGTFLCCRAAGVVMLERGGGSIVNLSSVAAHVGLTTGNANYAAAKGGVDALTRTLAVEWASRGVRVNSIAPTHFETRLLAEAIEADPRRLDYFLENIPVGRLGRPVDIVGGAIYLLSDASSMVTGHVLKIDGGHTIR